MSAQAIIREAAKFVREQGFPPDSQHQLRPALALANKPVLQLVYEIGLFSGLGHDQACQRSIPVMLQNCAIHLADDIADGDCDYLPISQAVTALYTLQQLFAQSLEQCQLPERGSIFRALAQVGAAQHEEIATQDWNIDRSMSAAKALNGLQFQAYFSLVSNGSVPSEKLGELGYSFGIVNHLANDLKSKDKRYLDLPEPDRKRLLDWGRKHAERIINADMPCLNHHLRPLLKYFR